MNRETIQYFTYSCIRQQLIYIYTNNNPFTQSFHSFFLSLILLHIDSLLLLHPTSSGTSHALEGLNTQLNSFPSLLLYISIDWPIERQKVELVFRMLYIDIYIYIWRKGMKVDKNILLFLDSLFQSCSCTWWTQKVVTKLGSSHLYRSRHGRKYTFYSSHYGTLLNKESSSP